MKLGISYIVFDGAELLKYAISSIRNQVDFVSVVYQTTSYYDNPAESSLPETIEKLKQEGLIDKAAHYQNNLSLKDKENELNIRNFGLDLSITAGCTHHISSDVDEFYLSDQFDYAKKVMDNTDFNYSVVEMETYYKLPTYRVTPTPRMLTTFIHPVRNRYSNAFTRKRFPFAVDQTRRLAIHDDHKLFGKDQIAMHHMSYVRKDIRRKMQNSNNTKFLDIDEFYKSFDNHKLGDEVYLMYDSNRRTYLVENLFGIKPEDVS